jgi:hypothetical protein
MAEVVVIEFVAENAIEIYNKVNKELGWHGVPDSAEWPTGMLSHVSGENGDKLIVVEVWESQAAQGEFMSSKLGPAFAAVGAPQPARIEWFNSVMDIHSHAH